MSGNKINLIFDLSSTQPVKDTIRHGGGIYGEIVFERMAKMGYRFSAVYDSSLWLNPYILDICRENSIELYDLAHFKVENIVQNHHDPLIYCPVSSILCNGVKTITTIHGLRKIEWPFDWFQLKYKNSFREIVIFFIRLFFRKYWRKRQIDKMFRLLSNSRLKYVTVSKHSKYSFLSVFPEMKANEIDVYYSPNTSINDESATPFMHPKKYFLLVSGNRWEKNNLRAMIALDEIFAERPEFDDFCAIVTGVNDLNYYSYRFRCPDRFVCKGYVEDVVLDSLYAGCYALVYPSLNEGFGYPPIEAMRYGKPVAASAITSIPEVCGNAALYFNPWDYREIKNRLLMLMEGACIDEYSKMARERYLYISKKQEDDLNLLIEWIVSECDLC